jgi:O-antigen ligase
MATATQALPTPSAAQKAGYLFLLLYLFIVYSRVIEVALPSLRATALIYAATLALAVLSGGFMRALSHPIGRYLAAFAIWLALATPFSIWRGGSVDALIEVSKNLPVFFLVGGLTQDFGETRKAIHTLAYAVLTLAFLTFFFGGLMDGRLMLSTGKFANPNDLAQALVLALPFWWLMGTKSGGGLLHRLAAFPAFAAIIFVTSRTGSRAALIAAVGAGIVFFLHVSLSSKLKLMTVTAGAVMLAAVIVPDGLRSRYLTLFEPDEIIAPVEEVGPSQNEGGPSYEKAVGSSESRLGLLIASLKITLEHPLFGVGPAMFQVAESNLAQEQGQKGNWHETHNAFTQVSSEAGVPALLFFIAVLALSIRSAHRIHKQCGRDPKLMPLAHTALALEVSLAAYAFSSCFASVAYGNMLPTLAGLAVALERSAAAALAALEDKAPAVAAPVPPRRRRPSLRAQAMR